MLVLSIFFIEFCAFIAANYYSQSHEREADKTGVLILASFNKLCADKRFSKLKTKPIKLESAIDLWTQFKPFKGDDHLPWIFNIFSTHPSNQERAVNIAQASLMVASNAQSKSILENPEKRRLFFEETEEPTSQAFQDRWNITKKQYQRLFDNTVRASPPITSITPYSKPWITSPAA